jgi:hypothetical protein
VQATKDVLILRKCQERNTSGARTRCSDLLQLLVPRSVAVEDVQMWV